jgi:hypothetical protein
MLLPRSCSRAKTSARRKENFKVTSYPLQVVTFELQWSDQPESSEPPSFRSIANSGWWRILAEVEAQGVGDVTEPPTPPRPPLFQRLFNRPQRIGVPLDLDVENLPHLDVDPRNCVYPIGLFELSYHGTVVVTERACRAMLQRLSREPTLEYDEWWPELWQWFYDYLAGAVEHGGFEVG